MIDRNQELPVKCQAELVGISRGCVYYLPRPLNAADLAQRLDRQADCQAGGNADDGCREGGAGGGVGIDYGFALPALRTGH